MVRQWKGQPRVRNNRSKAEIGGREARGGAMARTFLRIINDVTMPSGASRGAARVEHDKTAEKSGAKLKPGKCNEGAKGRGGPVRGMLRKGGKERARS